MRRASPGVGCGNSPVQHATMIDHCMSGSVVAILPRLKCIQRARGLENGSGRFVRSASGPPGDLETQSGSAALGPGLVVERASTVNEEAEDRSEWPTSDALLRLFGSAPRRNPNAKLLHIPTNLARKGFRSSYHMTVSRWPFACMGRT